MTKMEIMNQHLIIKNILIQMKLKLPMRNLQEDLDNKDKENNIENSTDMFKPFKQEAIENTQNFSKNNTKLQNQELKLTSLSKNNKEKKNNKKAFKIIRLQIIKNIFQQLNPLINNLHKNNQKTKIFNNKMMI
ncbi:hypothetical protein PPERSA_09863 [Pseudocohnilembus persalinus]|uniref:Uncharacterized protein n=1 Tax=Pseudocohnilembus persalinus TaxID=266149 RepID=A0A0V0QU41_PSEPJ|nr:hypothetical protein PPERSA_09863 [Pseudocohnilembus persalinus]|eukprot:KRX05723.1 hypothetical protein PPERSA_09863 [Pseudocohnilembus persalinus]